MKTKMCSLYFNRNTHSLYTPNLIPTNLQLKPPGDWNKVSFWPFSGLGLLMIGHLTKHSHRAITSIRAVNVSLHEAQHASSSVTQSKDSHKCLFTAKGHNV